MKLLERKELNLTPIFLMGNAIGLTFLVLLELVNSLALAQLANSKAPTLVELSNGESIRVGTLNNNERSPEAITYFVGQTMTGLFSWNAVPFDKEDSPLNKLKLDKGVQAGERKITTNVWATGFALSEDFRAPFLKEIGKLTPPDVFNGSTQSILKISLIDEPKKLKSGQWSVDMVAFLITFQAGNVIGEPIKFNKTIFVRAIDTPALSKNASDFQKTAYNVRKAGLEIYKIQDLELTR